MEDDLRKVLADIILGAVLHPDSPNYEVCRRDVLDRARFMLDQEDITAAARRARQSAAACNPPEDGDIGETT